MQQLDKEQLFLFVISNLYFNSGIKIFDAPKQIVYVDYQPTADTEGVKEVRRRIR